jgi:hypothetical protein
MAKYQVHVCRIAYSHLDLIIENANNIKEAELTALKDAGNHEFPTENYSEYTVEGTTPIN